MRDQQNIDERLDVEWPGCVLGQKLHRRSFIGTGPDEITIVGRIVIDDDMDEPTQGRVGYAIGHHVLHEPTLDTVPLRTATQTNCRFKSPAVVAACHLMVETAQTNGQGLNDVAQIPERYDVPAAVVHVQAQLMQILWRI